jgi:TolA-binding protein
MYAFRILFFAVFSIAALRCDVVVAGAADDQYAVAARHYERGRWELAAQEFKSFLRDYSEHPRANSVRFFLGESLVQTLRYAEAGVQFQQFVNANPQHRYARQAAFRIGESAFLRADFQTARTALKGFLLRYPHDPMNAYTLPYLGEIELADKSGTQAQLYYQQALERYLHGPLSDECRFGLARSTAMLGNSSGAIEQFTALSRRPGLEFGDDVLLHLGALHQRSGDDRRALEVLERFVQQFGQSELLIDANYWRAEALRRLKRWDEAESILRVAVVDASQHRLADALQFSLAETLRAVGKSGEAAERYRQIVEHWPDSKWVDDSQQILVQLAADSEDPETARRMATEFLEQHADSPLRRQVQQALARAHLKAGRYGDATAILVELTQPREPTGDGNPLRPGSQSYAERANKYYLALAYLGNEKALDALRTLDDVRPAAAEGDLLAGVMVTRASALIALERFDEAVSPLRAYLDDNPQGSERLECRAKLIVALAETEQFDDAASEHQQFREDGAAHELYLPTTEFLAAAALANGKFDLAEELLRQLSAAGTPESYRVSALTRLGQLQVERGNPDSAAATLARLIEIAPSDVVAAAALSRGRALRQSDRNSEALEAYQLAIDQNPVSSEVATLIFEMAQINSDLQRHLRVQELLERLLSGHPEFAQRDAAIYLLAWTVTDLGQPDAGLRRFDELAREHRGSEFRADAVFRLAKAAVGAGELAKAESHLQDLLGTGVGLPIRPHALYLQGQVAALAERWPDVASPLLDLVEEYPCSPLRVSAEYWIAESHFRQQQFGQAEELLSQLATHVDIARQDWAPMIPLRRSQIHLQNEEWQAAHELAEQMRLQYPDFERLYEADYLLGRCLAAQARFTDSRQAYQRVVDSSTGHLTETAAMAQWMIGESHFHQKNFQQAIKAYHRVESLYAFPRWQAAALLQAGKCHELSQNWKQAIQLYHQLLEEFPENTFADEASGRLKIAQRQVVGNVRN